MWLVGPEIWWTEQELPWNRLWARAKSVVGEARSAMHEDTSELGVIRSGVGGARSGMSRALWPYF